MGSEVLFGLFFHRSAVLSLHKHSPTSSLGTGQVLLCWRPCSQHSCRGVRGGRCDWWYPTKPNHSSPWLQPSVSENAPNDSVQNSLFYFIFFFVRQTHWFLDHSRGWKPFTNLFIWKYKYKIILSTSVMWETAIHIVIFYNRALRKPHTKTWKMLEIYIYIDTYICIYIKKILTTKVVISFILKYKSKGEVSHSARESFI